MRWMRVIILSMLIMWLKVHNVHVIARIVKLLYMQKILD